MRIFVFIFVFLAAIANAFYICTGKVEGLTLKPANGQVLVERIGELKWPVLCSVVNNRGHPKILQFWHSGLDLSTNSQFYLGGCYDESS